MRDSFDSTVAQVSYEQMVANPKFESRRLVAALGLPWDDCVLEFYSTERHVATMSAAQVNGSGH